MIDLELKLAFEIYLLSIDITSFLVDHHKIIHKIHVFQVSEHIDSLRLKNCTFGTFGTFGTFAGFCALLRGKTGQCTNSSFISSRWKAQANHFKSHYILLDLVPSL